MDFKESKSEIRKEVNFFYSKINNKFFYYEKNSKQLNYINTLLKLSQWFMILNFLGIIPYFTVPIIKNSNWFKSGIIEVDSQDLILIYYSLACIPLLVFGIWQMILDKRIVNRGLNINLLAFAYLYNCISEIEKEDELNILHNLKQSKKYFKKYFDKSILTLSYYKNFEYSYLFIPLILSKYRVKNNWIKYDDSTIFLIEAFCNFEQKIEQNIMELNEKNKIINVLNPLLLLEYQKIQDKITQENELINSDYGLFENLLLNDVAENLNLLEITSKPKIRLNDLTIIKKMKYFYVKTCEVFTHKNVLITFLAWCFLLTFITLTIYSGGLKILNINANPDSYMNGVIGIIGSAIVITVGIYQKERR